MSVLINGMKMPEKCGLCDLFHAESPMHCTVVKGHKTVGAPYGMPRPEWCPLVALPDKHGDLIDKDEVIPKLNFINEAEHQIYGRASWGFTAKCIHAFDDAPTVIEAEGK